MSLAFQPLFWADYLGDTSHLSTEQHGAYLLLIGHYWQHGKLPTEDAALARICRASAYKWAKLKPTIAAFFSPEWKHKRIERDLSRMVEKRAKCKISGSKGGLRTQKLFRDLGGIPQGFQSLAQANAKAIARANAPANALADLKREIEPSLSAPLEPRPRERTAEVQLRPRMGELIDPSSAIRAKLIDAAQGNISQRAALDVAPIARLRAQGYSLEKHILPVISELVPQLEKPLASWKEAWLLTAILNKRESALAEGRILDAQSEPDEPRMNGAVQ